MNFQRFQLGFALLTGVSFVGTGSVQAAPDASAITTTLVEGLVKVATINQDHRPLLPARGLGLALGLDVGVTTTLLHVPTEVESAMTTFSGTAESSVPSYPLPRLYIHKGLPFGLGVGMSYMGYQNISLLGFDASWNFLDIAPVAPSLAVRASYHVFNVPLIYISAQTVKVDVLASLPWFLIEPYAGLGLQMGSGTLSLPSDTTGSSPVSTSDSITSPHLFVGLPLKLALVNVVGEVDYSFSGVFTAAFKLSLNL